MTFALADLVRRHAQERPLAPAVTCGAVTRTFAELDARSSQVAQRLAADGVGRGDRVAVLDRNSAELVEVLLGCAKLGAVLVGLNWRLAPPELAAVVADARPSRLLVGPDQALTGDVVLGESYEQWLAQAPAVDPRAAVGGDDPVLQLYSSGTTGAPKGALLTHANLEGTVVMAAGAWRMTAASTNLVASPQFHIGGVGYGLTALSQGGRTVVVRDASATTLLAAIEQHRVTHAFLVPTVVAALVDAAEAAGSDLSSLQLIGYGGAPMTGTALRRALRVLGCDLTGVYGSTEAAGTLTVLAPEEHDPDGPRAHLLSSVGRALPWVELAIVDPQSGRTLPVGEVAEIRVRASQVMAGYAGRPDLTGQAVVDGWLRTGDLAHVDADGYVFLHDRLHDLIITGGENVYPAEVEDVLAAHPSVAEVAVVGVPHPRWGQSVAAFVVLHPGGDLDDLDGFARARLAGYECPTTVEVVDALPRNASGKVLRRQLRDR